MCVESHEHHRTFLQEPQRGGMFRAVWDDKYEQQCSKHVASPGLNQSCSLQSTTLPTRRYFPVFKRPATPGCPPVCVFRTGRQDTGCVVHYYPYFRRCRLRTSTSTPNRPSPISTNVPGSGMTSALESEPESLNSEKWSVYPVTV